MNDEDYFLKDEKGNILVLETDIPPWLFLNDTNFTFTYTYDIFWNDGTYNHHWHDQFNSDDLDNFTFT